MLNTQFKKFTRYSRTTQTILELQMRSIVLKQDKKTLAKWLCSEFQVLGPTYIKIGQFISTRKDIFGSEFSGPFECLRSEVIAIKNENYLHDMMKNKEIFDMFFFVDINPIAAASISQVHKARLKTGEDVVIKVKRPDLISNITDDIAFLRNIINTGQKFAHNDNIVQSLTMLNDFENLIQQETDFIQEARNIRKFKDNIDSLTRQPFKEIHIPRVYSALSSNDLIVMEYIPSFDLITFNGNRKYLAINIMKFFIKQVVDIGIVHGDPHEGNIGIAKNGDLIVYDFGNVIEISANERNLFKELVYNIIGRNNQGAITTLKKLGIKVLNNDNMLKYIDLYVDYIKTLDIALIYDSHNPSAKLPLILSDKIFRLIRVFSILEGVCKKLDKDFNYLDVMDEYTTMMFVDMDFFVFKANQDIMSLTSYDSCDFEKVQTKTNIKTETETQSLVSSETMQKAIYIYAGYSAFITILHLFL